MAKTIKHFQGRTVGHVGLGVFGDEIGTVKRQVYDGDTITVRALGNLSIRFLGIDTAEKNIPLPGRGDAFISLSDPRWDAFLSDPFAAGGPLSPSPFSKDLTSHLKKRIVPGLAKNHRKYGEDAEDLLEQFVQADLQEMGMSKKDFSFYLRFAFEIMDGYGRFLCFINRDQPNANVPSTRPPSYNERMLQAGMASPYFIWPNINPWRAYGSIVDAVFAPGTANEMAEADAKLKQARDAVKAARQDHVGIFCADDPLLIQPFEIRYLSRCSPPSRWVIDLSQNDDILIHPENYYTVPYAEDRLYISPQHVPLFVQAEWQEQEGS